MGNIKVNSESIFNTEKDIYHTSFQFITWSLPYLAFSLTVINLPRGLIWAGSFLNNFQ